MQINRQRHSAFRPFSIPPDIVETTVRHSVHSAFRPGHG